MKKLLAIGFLGLLSMGNMFSHVPKQRIFSAYPIHTIEPVNMELVDNIRLLFPDAELYLYNELETLYDINKFDKENILALINWYKKDKESSPITILDTQSLVEFLRYYKNIISQKIIDLIKKQYQYPSFGDTIIEDYGILTTIGIGGFLLSTRPFQYQAMSASSGAITFSPAQLRNFAGSIHLQTIAQLITFYMGVYGLYYFIPYYRDIRHNESKMRKIEQLIAKIETLKD